jgi:hypothetical protein
MSGSPSLTLVRRGETIVKTGVRAPGAMVMKDDDRDDDEDATVPVQIGEPGPLLCPTCGRPLVDLHGTGILACPKCGSKPSQTP